MAVDNLMRFDRPIVYEGDADLRKPPRNFAGDGSPTFGDFLYDSTIGNFEGAIDLGGNLLESIGRGMAGAVGTLDEVDDLFLEGLKSIYEGTASFENVPKNLAKIEEILDVGGYANPAADVANVGVNIAQGDIGGTLINMASIIPGVDYLLKPLSKNKNFLKNENVVSESIQNNYKKNKDKVIGNEIKEDLVKQGLRPGVADDIAKTIDRANADAMLNVNALTKSGRHTNEVVKNVSKTIEESLLKSLRKSGMLKGKNIDKKFNKFVSDYMDDLFHSPEGLKKFSDMIYDSNKKFIKGFGRKGRKVWNKMDKDPSFSKDFKNMFGLKDKGPIEMIRNAVFDLYTKTKIPKGLERLGKSRAGRAFNYMRPGREGNLPLYAALGLGAGLGTTLSRYGTADITPSSNWLDYSLGAPGIGMLDLGTMALGEMGVESAANYNAYLRKSIINYIDRDKKEKVERNIKANLKDKKDEEIGEEISKIDEEFKTKISDSTQNFYDNVYNKAILDWNNPDLWNRIDSIEGKNPGIKFDF